MSEKEMQDSVMRFLFDNHGVRGEIMHMRAPAAELIAHDYPASVKKLLLELASAAVLVAATLKDGSEISLQIKGSENAPLKYALVNISQDLSFYGSASINQETSFPDNEDADLEQLTGKDGVLILSVFPESGTKWQGVVALDTNSISASLQKYFQESQQLPTNFFIWSDTQKQETGGILLQIIPEIEGNLESLEHLSVLTASLTKEELFNLPKTECLSRLFAHEQVRIFKEKPTKFKCVCSKERCLNALRQLDRDTLLDMVDEGKAEMTCQHCGKHYTFSQSDLKSLLLEVSQ